MIDDPTIQKWPASRLIRESSRALNSQADRAVTWVHVLTNEKVYGFASEEQRNALHYLQAEVEALQTTCRWLQTWLAAQGEDSDAPAGG